ncbi:hypothetical protein vBVpaS1601_48 [Vibrio phage vB_VpaS_1601]|nr:hypothetical protein vBVpaP1601_48 [Vibrio phage vB_VpaP_1601]
MYLFYQQSTEKDDEGRGESWKSLKDSPDAREALAGREVQMVSMLAISSTNADLDYESLKYRGDLYFDIDNENLEISIASTIELIKKLEEKGVYDYVIYLSGKKGFHVTVPAKVFNSSNSSGVKWLPYIYGKMAFTHFAVEGLDPSVYSGGKGRLWRQPNVKRQDNGQYKVPVRRSDLDGMTVESYKELASKPNHDLLKHLEKQEVKLNLDMATIFEEAAIVVKKEMEEKESYRYESIPELEMLSEVPGCIQKLVDGEDVKEGANFNKAAMNLAGYLKSTNKIGTDLAEELSVRLTSHNHYGSASYTNERARRQHLKGAIRRAKHDKAMGCNPAYILSSVERCGGCVICDGTLDKRKDKGKKKGKEEWNNGEAEDGLRHNIFEQGCAYLKQYGPRSIKTLTTFLIEPESADIYYNQEMRGFRRESLKCVIRYQAGDGEEKTARVIIEEDAWDSPSLFKKQFSGIDNLAITCSEDDLADLRHHIMSKHNDIDTSIRTQTIGLDVKEIPCGDKMSKVLVYTEPGYTASGNVVRVPVHYESDARSQIVGQPEIHKAPDLNPNDKDDVRVCKDIFKVNEAWVCATMVGWMSATALKPHITSINNEFPLLAVTGRPGTGKTTIASLMADLAGCTYGQTGEPASANSSPAFIERYIATSTSTPRLLDECNMPAFRSNPKLLETMKMVWNGLEIGKGSVAGSSAKAAIATRSIRMSGPLAYISEQPQQDDALRQRSIEVIMTMTSHGTTQTGEHIPRDELPKDVLQIVDSFEWVTEHEQRARLRGIAKLMIHQALKTKKSWVRDKLKYYAEVIRAARCHGRQKYGWRIILMGLDLYEISLAGRGIDVSTEVAHARHVIINRLLDDKVTDTGNVNVNTDVIKFIGAMAERSAVAEIRENDSKILIVRDAEYTKTDCHLILSIDAVWYAIAQQARTSGVNLKFGRCDQFVSAIKTEEYFVNYAGGLMTLDLHKLKEAGVNTNFFYTDEEFEDKASGC